ncbi:helix-turn-helix domain-containing protein [Neolewinella aurantiaca]|uniref:Helix-turn-helix domain-containing protein n=1 Tax=Neolewinella aurantiaca TaxID=2602767 RepID=A0A5C7FY85_9BACT|nr:XRE family transcriptional regulator [Neolewinella aurantiaca]TXF91493.1 helix-turn-helix domain-containing protein [Neolewinella aurantiaca]
MEANLLDIGPRLRDLRRAQRLSQQSVAEAAGLTKGTISKVETGRIIPTLPVLFAILRALDEDAESFFRGVRFEAPPPYTHRTHEDARPLERELASRGFDYLQLLEGDAKDFALRAVILEIEPGSSREKVTTAAYEYKYMLSGYLDYEIGEDTLKLAPGDSLFYDGRIPHVPHNRGDAPARMLVVYIHDTLLKDE